MPSHRRLNLADLAILVAASAAAFTLLKLMLSEKSATISVFNNGYRFFASLSPFLSFGSIALLLARSVQPRPSWRRITCQPGSIACATFLISFLWMLSLHLGHFFLQWKIRGASDLAIFAGREVQFLLLSGITGGQTISIAWLTLVVSGRWKAEASWIDRSGRFLGALAILSSSIAMLWPWA